MRNLARFITFTLGVIGAVDGFILNLLVSLYHSVERLTGVDPSSHGFIGFGMVVLALVGAVLALFWPQVGGVLLLLAGLGFIFVLHWWALLATPQLIIGGLIPFMAATAEEPTAEEHPRGQAPGSLAAE
jgi:hypothetical protein